MLPRRARYCRLGDPPLLAVTATAPPAVRADIGAALGRTLKVVQTPLFRGNLRYEVLPLPNAEAKREALVRLCAEERGSVVVYVNSRERTEELARMLRSQGISAQHYHAGMGAEARTATQDAFMLDRTRAIVATVAFGMGVDKANIRMVVHFSLPESLEAYVQESGRAGRDGRPARCVLLTAPSDKANLTRWLKAGRLSLDDLRAVYREVTRRLQGARVGVAVVDELGQLVQMDRMDGAGLLWPDVAEGVARTALVLQAASAEADRRFTDAQFAQVQAATRHRLVALAGGQPIIANGWVVGAIGVCGSGSGELDELIARCAVGAEGEDA